MKLPKRILVGYDFSEISARALGHALGLATASGASVVVFNAFGEALELPAAANEAERAARAALEQALAPHRRADLELTAVARWVEPAVGIIQAALDCKADLIVLGTHGRSGVARAFLGSVAETVVRASTRPVLLIRGVREGAAPPPVSAIPRRIVVPTDFGEASERSLDEAVELAAQVGASITLVHAYMNPVQATPSGFPVSVDLLGQTLASTAIALRQRVEARKASGVSIATEFEQAPAAPVVHEIVERTDADLIMLGTRGRSGLGRMVLGSVAEAIVRHATRPVLVFRGPKE
jgi:nucleotide-binding universal stress UspA family protein